MVRINRLDGLKLWHKVMLAGVRSEGPDLTARQFVILTTVYLIDEVHTVRSLSADLGVTKAVVTRGLDSLGSYGYVCRCPDPKDRRSVIIQRTPAGMAYLCRFGDRICADLQVRFGQAA